MQAAIEYLLALTSPPEPSQLLEAFYSALRTHYKSDDLSSVVELYADTLDRLTLGRK